MNSLLMEREMDLSLDQFKNWTLKSSQVRVWTLELCPDVLDLDEMTHWLSGDELNRAGEFKFARDRRRYIAARAGLREILAGILGETPEALRFKYNTNGKPLLWGQEGMAKRLHFNVSHSGDLALVAAAWDMELGVDLELKRKDYSLVDSAQLFFHAREKDWLYSHSEENRLEAFYKLWTLKESVCKAKGLGLGGDRLPYCVVPNQNGAVVIWDAERDQKLEIWKAHSFAPVPGYQGAIAFAHQKAEEFQLDFVVSSL